MKKFCSIDNINMAALSKIMFNELWHITNCQKSWYRSFSCEKYWTRYDRYYLNDSTARLLLQLQTDETETSLVKIGYWASRIEFDNNNRKVVILRVITPPHLDDCTIRLVASIWVLECMYLPLMPHVWSNLQLYDLTEIKIIYPIVSVFFVSLHDLVLNHLTFWYTEFDICWYVHFRTSSAARTDKQVRSNLIPNNIDDNIWTIDDILTQNYWPSICQTDKAVTEKISCVV